MDGGKPGGGARTATLRFRFFSAETALNYYRLTCAFRITYTQHRPQSPSQRTRCLTIAIISIQKTMSRPSSFI